MPEALHLYRLVLPTNNPSSIAGTPKSIRTIRPVYRLPFKKVAVLFKTQDDFPRILLVNMKNLNLLCVGMISKQINNEYSKHKDTPKIVKVEGEVIRSKRNYRNK